MNQIDKLNICGIEFEIIDSKARKHLEDKNNPHNVQIKDIEAFDTSIEPTNNQALMYNSKTGKYEPKTIQFPEQDKLSEKMIGEGNAITAIKIVNNELISFKGKNFIESETKLSKSYETKTERLSNNSYIITDIGIDNHELKIVKQRLPEIGQIVTSDNLIIEEYTPLIDYKAGVYLTYDDNLYYVNESFTADNFADDLKMGRLIFKCGINIPDTLIDFSDFN